MENKRNTEGDPDDDEMTKMKLLEFMKQEFIKLETFNWGESSSRKGINYEQMKELILRSGVPIEDDEQFMQMCEILDKDLSGWIEYERYENLLMGKEDEDYDMFEDMEREALAGIEINPKNTAEKLTTLNLLFDQHKEPI